MSVSIAPTIPLEIASTGTSKWKTIGGLISVLALPMLWFAPLPLEARAQHALAISCFMILLWICEIVPHAITGLIGCWLFWALGVVPTEVVFRGFTNQAPWFLLGALFIGLMVTESGLGRRIALSVLSCVGTSYTGILLGFILTSVVLTFMIPAGPPRVILLGSIVLGVVALFGVDKNSNIAKGSILAITFTATLFDKTILGSTPAILARSLIERFGHVQANYAQWFLAYIPLDLVNIALAWWLVLRLYPPEVKLLPGGKATLQQEWKQLGSWTGREKRAAFWTVLAVVLWFTGGWIKVRPEIVGLGVGLAATLPVIGVLSFEDLKKTNFFIVIFMGTTISMAEVLGETKALDVLASSLFSFLGPYINNVMHSTLILYWAAFAAHLVLASETSMIAVSMPLVMRFALQNHLNPLALGMVWSFATGGKLFIYQSLVLIAGYTFGCYGAKDVFKIGLFFLIIQSLLMLLIVPIYWPLIGIG